MSKILVPTDFSTTARNAISFAVRLAMQRKCSLVIFHAIEPDAGMQEGEVLHQFSYLKKELETGFRKKLNIDYVYEHGKLEDVFQKVAKKYKADLLLMGTNGVGKAMGYTFGSNAYSVVEMSSLPVMVVPPEAEFDGVHKIVLALDFRQDFSKLPLLPLLKTSKLLGGEILLLSVIPKEGANVPKAVIEIKKFTTLLKDIPHSFHYMYRNDVENAINDFAKLHFADLIMLFPQKHSWFNKLFKKSHTRNMVYQVKTPLMTLQD